MPVSVCKSLQPDGKLYIARSNNVLNLEISKLCLKPKFLNDASILSRCEFGHFLRLCASDDHFARSKDERSRLWLSNSHNDRSESLVMSFKVTPLDCTLRCEHGVQWF